MKIKNIFKIFSPPGPYKLGMSDVYENLPSKFFNNGNNSGPTWEDWEERVKKEYSIRYFIYFTFFSWIKRLYIRLIDNPLYWLKCHLLSKYKYHIIDLREPRGPKAYRYGFIDTDMRMYLAIFALFNDFVKNSNLYCPSEEEVEKDQYLLPERQLFLEIKYIHYWYNVERVKNKELEEETLNQWFNAKNVSPELEGELWKKLNDLQQANQVKEDEMIIRLMKIRRSLWS